MDKVARRLTTILAADVVGYSRLMGADEVGTHRALKATREELIAPKEAQYHGRTIKLMGDGALMEFASVVEAVQFAVELQRAMRQRNAALPEERRIVYRIGINLGDIIVDGDDVYGDGVNVAARLEALAEPGGICVRRNVRDEVRDKLDILFEDLGEIEVKNIARPVRCFAVRLDDGNKRPQPSAAGGESTTISPDKPSLAVLPFTNMSGDPEQDYFVDGLVEDIITTLSKLAGLRVIARNSSFVYKGRSVDVRDAAKQLGVRYVLEGSVRKSGKRIRITVQLIDAEDGAHLWAERYDRTIDDIFAIQDEITLILATEMQVKLTEGEQARLRYTTTDNVEAWTYWVQGLSHYRQAVTKVKMGPARHYWEKALALDPASATLNGMLGFIHYIDARFGWWDDRQTARGKARSYADRALELDPENPDANTASSCAMLLEGRYDAAAVHARRAAQLAPGSADAASFACFVLASAGYSQEAVAHGERAMTLSPNYPAYYLGHLGNAYRLAGRVEEAITAFTAYNDRNAGFGLADLVIAYQQIERPERAKEIARQLLSIRREFTIASWMTTQLRSDSAQFEADIEALRAAGLPMN